jgi:AcrR family transcriptional regulator
MPGARGDTTRGALIQAATRIFARDGYHAASTRAIARAARVNQALIGYHFQGKAGLYLAVFESIAREVGQAVGPALDAIEARLAERDRLTPDAALALAIGLTDAMAKTIAAQAPAQWATLVLREQQEPTRAFAMLYERFMNRVLDALTGIAGTVRPHDDEETLRLRAIGVVGLVIVFRTSRAAVLRHLGWGGIDAAALQRLRAQVRASVTAQLTAGSGS